MDVLNRVKSTLGNRSGFGFRFSVLVGGTALSQLAMALAMPILTRIYSPADYGVVQIYVTILGFGLAIIAGRYELAIVLPRTEEEASPLIILSFGLVVILSVVMGFGVAFIGMAGILPQNMADVRSYLWLLPFSLITSGIYTVCSYWAIRVDAFADVAKTKVTQAIGQAGVQVGLGLAPTPGPWGLLIGDAVGRAAGTVRLGRKLFRRGYAIIRATTWEQVAVAAKRYRAFPLYSGGSALLNAAGSGLPLLFIGSYFGPETLGRFALVDRVLSAPMLLVGQAVSQVYMREAAQCSRDDVRGLRRLFFRRIKQLALLGLPVPLVVLVLGPWLFSVIFGDAWEEAGRYAQILALMHYISFVIWPLSQTLNVLERQAWQLGWDIVRLLLSVGFIIFAKWAFQTDRATVLAYAWALAIAYLAHFGLSYEAIRRKISSSWSAAQE